MRQGDRIVAVNCQHGIMEMRQQLATATYIELVLRRPEQWELADLANKAPSVKDPFINWSKLLPLDR